MTAEAYMPVRHHLAAREEPERLQVVYVHPQTHEQCSDFIERLGIEVVHTSSNAASALAMQKHERAGAIVSRMTAELYGLPLVCEDVQNSMNNTTRFVRLSRQPRDPVGCTRCSILIDPAIDRAGLLCDLLSVFARRGINLTRIESRPSRRGMGNYIFFVDFDLNDRWHDARTELCDMTQLKELGCYVTLEVPVWT
ncbi:MAG: prephenate dehydratase domain-containing protein [Methanomicrobiaceae archaeon]|nr:prephenate dehydratase domain-containing protein [Methanomicrobiaceae archaeon]